jgi:hypothetical protein
MTTKSYYSLSVPWTKVETLAAALVWLGDFDEKDAGFDYVQARSYINGIQYPGYVYFVHEEDYLMFKLKFPTLLKF